MPCSQLMSLIYSNYIKSEVQEVQYLQGVILKVTSWKIYENFHENP